MSKKNNNKLKAAFTKLENKVLSFIDQYRAKIIGLVALGVVVAITLSFIPASYQRPAVTKEFADTSVMIIDRNQESGGSGVILTSNLAYSIILTNKHVCRLTKGGGFVVKGNRSYLVHSIKRYPVHDLCMVKVYTNFGVNTKVAGATPTDFNKAYISGHPALLPHVLTTGNFSGHQIINLIVGIKECDENTDEKYMLYCIFMGGVPIIQQFDSQLVTGTILPGSSGSGVFNTDGEIAGLVFAGRGDGLGYAFIVPHQYVVDFVENQDLYEWKEVNSFNYDKMIRSIFNTQTYCTGPLKTQFRNFCKARQDYLIWKR